MADTVTQLHTLFEREYQALRKGDLGALDTMAAAKTQLLSAMGPVRDVDKVRNLQRLAKRNAQMLEAARRGVATVRARLLQLNGDQPALQTYTRGGQVQALTPDTRRIERKA